MIFLIRASDERMHVHVSNTKSRSGKPAKIRLDTLEIFDTGSLTAKEISTALKLLEKHKDNIETSIHTFAIGGKIETLHLR